MSNQRLSIIKETDAYWRVVFSNGELNMFDPWTFAELNVLLDDLEQSQTAKVVVFESDNPHFFMNHHDVPNRTLVPEQAGAKPFFYHWTDFVVRLAKLPIISIAKVRGRAWAQGFEFALACDMRFASEKALFGLVEVGGAVIPGGGGVEWLSALVGRSRAIEMVCSADGYDAQIGERYGFINRAVPDEELDEFVDKLARRMSRFEKRALSLGKQMVNERTGVPSQGDLLLSNHILRQSDDWAEGQTAFVRMQKLGLGSMDFELNLAERLGQALDGE